MAVDSTMDEGTERAKGDERSDAELLRSFLEHRDRTAVTAMVNRHGPMVMNVCRSVLDRDEAADAFQATFLVLLTKARSLGKPDSLASWLHGVASRVTKRLVAQQIRNRSRARELVSDVKLANDPGGEAASSEVMRVIHTEIERLPGHIREAIVLCCLEGCTREEAAHRLGWSVGAVKGRLERGRQMLSLRLGRRGIAVSTASLTTFFAQLSPAAVEAALAQSAVDAALLASLPGNAAITVISQNVLFLAQGVLKTMWIKKLQSVCGTVVLAALAVTGSAVVVRQVGGAAPAPAQAEAKGKVLAAEKTPAQQTPKAGRTSADEAQRAAMLREKSRKNLATLLAAMHSHAESTGAFPAAAINAADGTPLLSWRVAILPHLGHKQLYDQFRGNEPWDSPNNKPLLAKMPDVFAAPGMEDKHADATFYQVIKGEGAVFTDQSGLKFQEITDGTVNTAVLVEASVPVPWTKPADLPFTGNRVPKLGGIFPEGIHLATADGFVRFIRKDAPASFLRSMITAAGGEVVDPNRMNHESAAAP